jgi:CDP-6-deoxy-D-xylo-4-hexulose-3-dehydrase
MQTNDDFIKYDFSRMKTVSNFAMPVVCKDKKTTEHYKNIFEEAKVEIRPVIAGNMNRQPFYKKYSMVKYKCPASDLIHANGFYFGNNAEMNSSEIKTLVDLLGK